VDQKSDWSIMDHDYGRAALSSELTLSSQAAPTMEARHGGFKIEREARRFSPRAQDSYERSVLGCQGEHATVVERAPG
jgi:hypothetical protein